MKKTLPSAPQVKSPAIKALELTDEEKEQLAIKKRIDSLILNKKIQEALELIEQSKNLISDSNYYIVFKIIHLDKVEFLPILNKKNVFDNSFPRDKFFEYLIKHKAAQCASWFFDNNLFYSPRYINTTLCHEENINKDTAEISPRNNLFEEIPNEVKQIIRKGLLALIDEELSDKENPISIDIFNNFIHHTCLIHSEKLIHKIRQHIFSDLNHIKSRPSEFGINGKKLDKFWVSYSTIFDTFFNKYALEKSLSNSLPASKIKFKV